MVMPKILPAEATTASTNVDAFCDPVGVNATRHGAAIVLVLDRGHAPLAVTTAMRAVIAAALSKAARDPEIYAVILKSAGPNVFCSGGDLRELVQLAGSDVAAARRSLAEEYALVWRLECFSKPHVALIDGLVVGSGVGLSLYGTHRVAGPGYRFAMPETAIGLFPHDGVVHALSRMPSGIGAYLALAGRRIGRADALALGLITHCVPAEAFADIEARLAAAEPVDRVLDTLHQDPGPGELAGLAQVVSRCFSGTTVGAIMGRLEAEQGAQTSWAREVHAELSARAPLSLAVTLKHLQDAAAMDLRQVLMVDYRLAARCLAAPDFAEGVRAGLTDSDNAPRWSPARLEDVTPGMIERFFRPGPDDALVLLTRQEMQAAKL
jgi:enoyl-CoA hydratase